MRTFRRPMFRKGGNVGDGIMTGIVDRSMHAEDPFCLLYTSPSPRDGLLSRMPSSA